VGVLQKDVIERCGVANDDKLCRLKRGDRGTTKLPLR